MNEKIKLSRKKVVLDELTKVANEWNPWNIVLSFNKLKIVYALLASSCTKAHSCQMVPNKEKCYRLNVTKFKYVVGSDS